ncbi:TonB-dependent receptor domain-containing protein [Chitinophagaceae bacterium LWZ2-11]
MRALLFNLFIFLFIGNVSGQVSGKLITSTGQAVPSVNILVLNKEDSAVVKRALSNDKGIYMIDNIANGNYVLHFSSVGFSDFDSPAFEISASQKNKDFGTQIMKETVKQLEDVVVKTEKPLYKQQIDGIVINVENSILTKGSSALEVLERSPGIIIDYRNNSISLNGKNDVRVMLNGKLMNMSIDQVVALLRSMSANNIEKIELLTTPSAKYDAEGSAGIINIVLKQTKKQGTTGTFSVTGGYGWGEKGTASLNLSHNSKRTNLYSSYTFSHDRTYSDLFITSSQNMPALGGQLYVESWDTTKATRNNHDATLGIDFKLNTKTMIGGSLIYSNSSESYSTFTRATYNILPDSLLLFSGIVKGINGWQNLMPSLYLERVIKEGEKINFGLDYLWFKNNDPSNVSNSFLNKNGTAAGTNDSLFSPIQKGFANTIIQVGVAKIDYTKQVNKKIKLETGIKGSYTRSGSEAGIQSMVNGAWVSRVETSNNILMKESIGAAYISATAQLKSVTMTIGARYEYANTRMNDAIKQTIIVNRRQGALFPNILLSKKLNDNSELQLSYTKRISRPSYNDLASYVTYSDPSAVFTGNPLLKPTITNNIKLGYNYRGYTFSLLFSRDDYPIARYQLTESPARNLLYVSPQNVTYQNNITLQVNTPFKVNDWWKMNYGFVGGLRQFKVDYTILPVEKTYYAYSANFSELFKLPGQFSAELSGWYNSTSYNGETKVDGFGALNVGIKKDLKNNGGSFQLAVSDVLRTVHINTYYGTLTEEAFSIKNHVAINTESAVFPIIKLTYSKSFGTSTVKPQRKQDIGSSDERDRIRKD